MDIKDMQDIKDLAELFDRMKLTVLEFSSGDAQIRFEKSYGPPDGTREQAPAPGPVISSGLCGDLPSVADSTKNQDNGDFIEVKSPMVGVFYQAPAEDADPFVKKGQRVAQGDVLCIIEAMKLMNEITADADGEISDICVKNGQLVEFDQTIFKITSD